MNKLYHIKVDQLKQNASKDFLNQIFLLKNTKKTTAVFLKCLGKIVLVICLAIFNSNKS